MKEQISNSYTQQMKELHGNKKLPDNRRAIVTGVSKKNIGEKIYRQLCKGNFLVDAYDAAECDLRNTNYISSMFKFAYAVDTLVLCHGFTELGWIENQYDSWVDDAININLTSHIKLISKFASLNMSRPYRKTIIVLGSMAANAVLNGSAPYCAAKAGLQHFVKCVAWELAPKGFDIYIINPSNVQDTPMTEKTIAGLARYRNLTEDQARSYWSSSNPRNEFLTKDEIARLVLDLALGKYPYLSGTPLNLGGGQR